MALALDTSLANVASGAGVNSLSGSYTCTGTGLILFAAAYGKAGADDTTTATYNGVGMTKIAGVQCPGDRAVALFYLIAPATGANTLVVNSGTSDLFQLSAISYTGAKQSGQPDASTTNTASTVTTISTSVTVVAAGSWLLAAGKYTGGTLSGGTGTTVRTDTNTLTLADSNGFVTAGSHSLVLNTNTNQSFGVVLVSIAPDPIVISVSDTVTGSDTPAVTRAAVQTVLDTVTGSEPLVQLIRGAVMSVLDIVTGSDTVTIVMSWIRQALHAASFTGGTKHSSNWTDQNKDATSFTNQTKH